MTRDEIIGMAREAGFMDMDSLSAKVTDMFYHGFPRTERIHLCSDDRIENFAALVAAAEREHLHKSAEAYKSVLETTPHPPAFDHDAMDVFAANRFHVKPCDKRLFGWQVTAGDGEQTLYVGRKPDCENVARKLAGAFLDGAFYYSGLANAPNPPVLSDERILEIAMSDDVSLIEDQGPGVRPRITVHNSIGGVYAFARAIERELLGENE